MSGQLRLRVVGIDDEAGVRAANVAMAAEDFLFHAPLRAREP